MPYPHTFAALAGPAPASYLDENFAAAYLATDGAALAAAIAALPGSATPLAPVAGGSAGADAQFSREDHRHPPQPPAINFQTGTAYTVLSTDNGGTVDLENAAPITVTVPEGLAAEFNCLFIQSGAGQVTFVASGGATLHQRSGFSKTAGQWAVVSMLIRTNAGAVAAQAVLAGDMA